MGRVLLLLVPALVALWAAGPAAAAPPIMRLSDVRAGMRCTGLSVVRGTAISSFDVEVVDVVSGDASSAAPKILVRTSGPAVDTTGIGFGFSGSPILCPDGSGVRRTAGAISESVNEYGNKTVLATPIEEMLDEPVTAPRGSRRLPAHGRPLSAALSVSGLSARVRRVLARAARRRGAPLLTPPAGPLGSFPRQSLAPGAAVSASLASGDITLGAIGTVSYRDGDRVLAFGHPLDGAGTRSLLMQDAYVYSVIANPGAVPEFSSYKLASPGHDLGTVGFDGLAAISGRVGALPPTTSLTVTARDPGGRRRAAIEARVADERGLELPSTLSPVGGLAIAQATDRVLRSAPARQTSSLCVRIRVRQARRPLGFCNSYFDAGGPIGDFEQAMNLLDGYFGRLDVTGVSARVRARRGVREALLVRGRAPRRVRPGRRVRIRLVVQERRGGRRRLSFVTRVPGDLRPGRRVLVVGPTTGESLEDVLLELLEGSFAKGGLALAEEGAEEQGAGGLPVTRTLSGLAGRIAAIPSPSGLNGRFTGSDRRVVLRSGSVLFRGKIRVPLRVVGRR